MQNKLKDERPVPTPAEQEICELFAKAKWAGKQSDTLKEQVDAIVIKYGRVVCETGTLMLAATASYSIPTLTEWQGRMEVVEKQISRIKTAQEKASILSSEAVQELTDLELQLKDMKEMTDHLRSYHETASWAKEMQDYFKAAGVTLKESTPTTKFHVVKAAPQRPAKRPKEKAAAAVA